MVRGRKSKDPRVSSDLAVFGHLDDWEELAVDYLDDRLDAGTRAAVEAHLDDCPSCAARLAAQRQVVALIGSDSLAQVPTDLGSEILERVLETTQPTKWMRLLPRRNADQPYAHRRGVFSPSGPWLPALAGAAAVVVLVLALTITRGPAASDDSVTGVADVAAAEEGGVDELRDGEAGGPSTTSQVNLVAASTTISSLPSAVAEASEDPTSFASLRPIGPLLEGREAMATGLAGATTTAFFFFDPADGEVITDEIADTVAASITSATGLGLVDRVLSSGVKAFAAFVPRDDSAAVVSLLSSIADSHKLSVCLSLDPGSEVSAWADSMLQDESAVPELSASPGATSESEWAYTTSTASPTSSTTTNTTEAASRDDKGTHVLVVILMDVQDPTE